MVVRTITKAIDMGAGFGCRKSAVESSRSPLRVLEAWRERRGLGGAGSWEER